MEHAPARSTGGPSTRPNAPASCCATRSRTSPTGPTRSASSSGGSRPPAPRSTTPRCCRTPAWTVTCSAGSWTSARRCAPWPRSPGHRRRPAAVAILFDWVSWWASRTGLPPDQPVALPVRGARLVPGPAAGRDPGRHRTESPPTGRVRLVVAPILHVVPAALADRLHGYVSSRRPPRDDLLLGHRRRERPHLPGGYPGALRDLLGSRGRVRATARGETVALDNGTRYTVDRPGRRPRPDSGHPGPVRHR